MAKRNGKFVVIWTIDDSTAIHSRVFFSRERARNIAYKLTQEPNVQACGTYRIGEKLGSFIRNGARTPLM